MIIYYYSNYHHVLLITDNLTLIVNKPNIFCNRLFSSALQKKNKNILSDGAGESSRFFMAIIANEPNIFFNKLFSKVLQKQD